MYIYIYTSSARRVPPNTFSHRCHIQPYYYLYYGRFPKFHRVFSGRDPGTLKSDIVSKKHPQLIYSDLRLSN